MMRLMDFRVVRPTRQADFLVGPLRGPELLRFLGPLAPMVSRYPDPTRVSIAKVFDKRANFPRSAQMYTETSPGDRGGRSPQTTSRSSSVASSPPPFSSSASNIRSSAVENRTV